MKNQKLKELIYIREEEFMNNNYSLSFTKDMKCIWREFMKYCGDYSIDYLDYNLCNSFIKDIYDLQSLSDRRSNLSKKQVKVLNAMNALISFDIFEKIYIKKTKWIPKDIFKKEIEDYLDYEKNIRNNAITTINEKRKGTIIFTNYLYDNNIFSLDKITKEIIIKYTDSFINEIQSKKIFINFTLRSFLNYLYTENILNTNYSFWIPEIKRNNISVPTLFDKEDVLNILEYLKENRSTKNIISYRNYAMILLAAKTGIRKIDIIYLKYENIDWNNNSINLIQQKTKKILHIPLPIDVGEAIIDYINHERPMKIKNTNDYIFIRSSSPLVKLSNDYSFLPTIIDAMNKLNIDINKYQKRGLHSFRFTLATEMLNNEVPLNIISSSLGHSSINSTKTYLKVNTKGLIKCFMEVDYEL